MNSDVLESRVKRETGNDVQIRYRQPAFALSNGVFARIFPLAPAPMVFAGIGFALSGTGVLPRVFARTAVLICGLFLIAGLAAVFATAGLILAIAMSVVEAVWIAAAAIALARTTAHT